MSGPRELPDGTRPALVDETRVRLAAQERARRRHLRELDLAEAGLLGTLWDLAEAQASVVVNTAAGRTVQGTLTTVGADFCSVRTARGVTHLPLEGIAALRPGPADRRRAATGVREQPTEVTLHDILAELAVERSTVMLSIQGLDQPVTATLAATGRDVLTLLPTEEGDEPLYVPLASLCEVAVFGSG